MRRGSLSCHIDAEFGCLIFKKKIAFKNIKFNMDTKKFLSISISNRINCSSELTKEKCIYGTK